MNIDKPLRREALLPQQLGDEWMLYDEKNGSVHIINSMAEFVWRLCDGSRNLKEIEELVRETFLVDDGVNLKQDLENIIQKFVDLGILIDE